MPAGERAALIALYNATGGPASWFSSDKLNWLGPSGTECTWSGVFCDAAGAHVTGIEFLSKRLVGGLPKELGNFPELEGLILHNAAELTGPLPSEIGKLKKLQLLSLQQTKLSDSGAVWNFQLQGHNGDRLLTVTGYRIGWLKTS